MEQPPTPAIYLEVRTGTDKGRRFELAQHGNFMVGRDACAHFRLPKDDRRVSRLHFMIEFNPPLCRLLDLGSRNGTAVNGERTTSADLHDGDLIEAGRTRFRLRVELPPPEPTIQLPLPPPLPQRKLTAAQRDATLAGPNPAKALEPDVGDGFAIPGYRFVRKLGQGGMGVVYLVQRLADGQELALKTIRPAQAAGERELKLFLREAAILMQLEHANIVSFREMGKGEGFAYFTMDYISGDDAARVVAREGALSVGRVARIAGQLFSALQYAHAAGFVHRDLKPANVLLSGAGDRETAHLADFGLARAYHDSPLSGLTMMGDVGGTVAFMAPEQVTNFREVQPAADQYAVAATLYYLLSGGQHVHDFDAPSAQKCLRKKLLHPHVPLRQRRADVPQKMAAAIDRALAREPKDRFRDVQELGRAILQAAT